MPTRTTNAYPKMWSVILEKEVTVSQVYQCMIAVKLSRLIETPDHEDSWLDVCGYGALGGEKIMSLQLAFDTPKSEWVPPNELPNIFDAKQIAVDVETRDPNIKVLGPGWARNDGEVVGYAIAVEGGQVTFLYDTDTEVILTSAS